MPRSNRDPLLGAVVGERFQVKRALAAGGMAAVYVARDGEKGPKVALKVLVPRGRHKQRLLELMRREGDALEALQHPHIVKALGHGPMDDGGWYIAMELVEGVSLTNWLREVHPSSDQLLRVFLQLCDALEHVHAGGYVHRDLKASNVLVRGTTSPHLTLIDFGVVRKEGEPEVGGDEPLLGGVHTSSPEQIKGGTVDHRSDVYSLGVLLYRAFSGRYPFHSKLPAEVLTQHLHGEVPPLAEGAPAGLERIVRRCLEKEPTDRFGTIGDLAEALEGLVHPPEARVEARWIVVVAVVIAALVLVYFAFA